MDADDRAGHDGARGVPSRSGSGVTSLRSRIATRRRGARADPAIDRVHDDRVALVVVGLSALLLCWSRLAFLDVSFWHDEAFSVMTYVDRGPSTMLFGDYTPNNHLLYSLLSWATTWRLGTFEAAYRIWSVLPGLVAVAIVGWWAWRRFAPFVGAAVVVLLTISPMHLDIVPQARGYGLGFLAGAGMLVGAARACDRGRASDVAWFAGFGLVGIWTLPPMVIPFLAQAAVVFVARHDLRRTVVVATAVVGFGSVLFYAPLASEIVEGSQVDYAGSEPLPWYGWATAPVEDLGQPTLASFLPDRLTTGVSLDGDLEIADAHILVRAALPIVCVLLAGLGAWRLARRSEVAVLALLLVPIIATYVVLTAGRFFFRPRYGSFLLIPLVVLLAIGILEIWELVRHRGVFVRAVAITTATALLLIGAHNVVQRARQLPSENFKLVGQVVLESEIRDVVTNSDTPTGLSYYLGRQRVRVLQAEALSRLFCAAEGPLVFIDHNNGSPDPDLACLESRGAVRIHVPQSRRGSLDVWFLTESPPVR